MKRIVFYITLIGILFPAIAHAGPWAQPEGGAYGKVSAGLTTGSGVFQNDGGIADSPSFTLLSADVYTELGITDSLTGVFQGSVFGFSSYDEESTAFSGPFILGARYGLIKGEVPFALELKVGADTGVGSDDIAINEPFRFTPVRVGGVLAELHASTGWASNGFWVTGNAGGRVYSNGQPLDLIAGLDLGYSFSNLELSLYFPFQWSLEKADIPNVAGSEETRYLGVGIGVGYWFNENIGISASAAGVAFAYANLAAPALSLGVQFKGDLF